MLDSRHARRRLAHLYVLAGTMRTRRRRPKILLCYRLPKVRGRVGILQVLRRLVPCRLPDSLQWPRQPRVEIHKVNVGDD